MNEQLTTLLLQLSDSLGTTTEYLWAILMKQSKIAIIQEIILIAIFTVIMVVLLRWLLRNKVKIHALYDEEPELFAVMIIVIIFVGIIYFTCLMFSCITITTILFNPEYWVLDHILDQL